MNHPLKLLVKSKLVFVFQLISFSLFSQTSPENKFVQVNIFGGTNPYNNAQWNNWNCSSVGSASPAFLFTDGTGAGITATLTASAGISDNGTSYGGTMCPPEVLRYVSYNTSNRTLTLKNLNKFLLYSIEFYASRQRTDNQQTTFTVNGLSATISTDNNKSSSAAVNNLIPNANGELVISILRAGASTYNYINGFKITVGSTGINQLPIVNAGAAQQISLPLNFAQLAGAASDPDGSISVISWSKISGPNVVIETPGLLSTRISSLEKGNYIFRLSITDNSSAVSYGDVNVSVTDGPPPIVNAGTDLTITLPVSTVNLTGQASSPSGISSTEWSQVSGPGQSQITTPFSLQTQVSNLIAGTYQLKFRATNNNGVSAEDLINIQVNNQGYAPPSIIDSLNCGLISKIVVIGSSTAAGNGASPIDSSFVNKLTKYIKSRNPNNQVVNLAAGALTTYETLCPTGFVPPANRPSPIAARNITAALAQNPSAIIINMPSNDIALGYSLQEQYNNFERTIALAAARNIPLWVSTSQPRNLNTSQKNQLMTLRDWINTRFGKFAMDFWNTLAMADGSINPLYNSGDGIHLNNLGHHLIFTRTVSEQILDDLCSRLPNILPQVSAGQDQTLRLPLNSVALLGTALDPDGSISQYLWTKLSGVSANIVSSSSIGTNITGLSAGSYVFRLRVTDDKGGVNSDDVAVTIQPPLVNTVQAGLDQSIQLPVTSATLSGINGDEYGTISTMWTQISGPSLAIFITAQSLTTAVSNMIEGSFVFALHITNLENNVSSDQVTVTVNPAPNMLPTVSVGDDQIIQLPVNSISLTGVASDPDGNINQYSWTKQSGGAAVISTSQNNATNITGLVAGDFVFRLTVTDNRGASSFDEIMVTVLPPLYNSVQAGSDQVIQLPLSSTTLSASNGNEYGTNAIQWNQISGPSTASFMTASSLTTSVSDLTAGIYVFEISITNFENNSSSDQITITVNEAPNIPPVVTAGDDQAIRLPVNTANLQGIASDQDGTITQYTWTKISGGSASIVSPSSESTNLIGLTTGNYIFRLTVRDNRNSSVSDDIAISVLPPLLNTVNAGTDQTIQLPIGSINLSGVNGNEFGTNSLLWTQLSGPSNAIIQTPAALTTAVSSLVAGSYIFNLNIINAEGNASFDQVTILVNPAIAVGKTLQVNIYGGSSPYNNSQWNNWNASTTNSPVFNFTDGTSSGIIAQLSVSTAISDNGVGYGGTMCPPEVLRFCSYTTTKRTLTLSNLKSNVRYEIYLYSSRARTDGQTTIFTVNGIVKTIATDNNKANAAVFTDILANASRQIVVNLAPGSTYNYINGFKLVEASLPSPGKSETLTMGQTTTLTGVSNESDDKYEISPNPFMDKVRIVSNFSKPVRAKLFDVTGRLIRNIVIEKPSDQYIFLPDLKKGMYYLVIESEKKTFVKKLMKN